MTSYIYLCRVFKKRYCQVTFYPFLSSHKLDPWRQSFGIQELIISYVELGVFCYQLDSYTSSVTYDDAELFDLPKLFNFLYKNFYKQDFYFCSIQNYFQIKSVPVDYKKFHARMEHDENSNDVDDAFLAPDIDNDNDFSIYGLRNDGDDGSDAKKMVMACRARLYAGSSSSSHNSSVC